MTMTENPSNANKNILPFSTTDLFESGFSALVQLKTKHRNRINIEHNLTVSLSSITSDSEVLMNSKKHPQLSY